MSHRISILDDGKWTARAEGRQAERRINGLGAVTILTLIKLDGGAVYRIDLRAVLERDGEIVCLSSSEQNAAETAAQRPGRRVLPARI